MVKVLLFPWFLLRLIWVVSPTLLELALSPLRPLVNLSIAIVVLSLVTLTTLRLYPTLLTPGQQAAIPFLAPPPVPTAEIEAELTRQLELYRLQPTDRDVLFNISLLYQALGDTNAADHYRALAVHSDPNSGLFR